MKWISVLIGGLLMASCNDASFIEPENGVNPLDTTSILPIETDSVVLELVYSDSSYQLTGVAKQSGGDLFVNYPRWSDSFYKYAVVRTEGLTGQKPFPNDSMNQWKPGMDALSSWVCVQSVYFDDAGSFWVLDPAAPKLKKIVGKGAKLVKMNAGDGKIEKIYSFASILPDTAYVNDVKVDTKNNFAFITESKGGGILVINLTDGRMRRVLTQHYSVRSDNSYQYIIDGVELKKDGKPVKIHSDGIALTPDGKWIYYKPLTDDKLYRIETAHLRDFNLADTALGNRVEDLGHFASTDGMIFDQEGNLYFGDPQNYSIIRISPDLKMKTIIKDPRLIWPDSYSIADGYLYISCSQINKQPAYNNGINKRTFPYAVYRIKL